MPAVRPAVERKRETPPLLPKRGLLRSRLIFKRSGQLHDRVASLLRDRVIGNPNIQDKLSFVTDKEKLQRLFDAALKDSSELKAAPPKRAVPVSPLEAVPVPVVATPFQGKLQPAAQAVEPAPVAVVQVPAPEETPAPQPAMSGVLDDAASTELAALLDEQHKRKVRKRRIEALVTAAVMLGATGGSTIWFVQSPQRVQAFKEAMRDIRSVGDVKSLVAKYQKSLDKIAARGQQVEQATAAMGVKKSAKDDEDPYMEAEMKQMMGGEGKTVGQRNRALQENFGHMAKKEGVQIKTPAAISKDDSFEWK